MYIQYTYLSMPMNMFMHTFHMPKAYRDGGAGGFGGCCADVDAPDADGLRGDVEGCFLILVVLTAFPFFGLVSLLGVAPSCGLQSCAEMGGSSTSSVLLAIVPR